MKRLLSILLASAAMLCSTAARVQGAQESDPETDQDIIWTTGEALITDASQIAGTKPQSEQFPLANLIRPESDGVGTNQYIYHTAWSGADVIPASTDPYLQFHFKTAEQHIIFSMIGSAWSSTYDTPTEVVVQAANLPEDEWHTITTLTNMEADFTSYCPERYTSPHIDFGAEYTDVKFLIKKTYANRRAGGSESNGLLLSLGRFQIYRAVQKEKDDEPVNPRENINLVFIGNSITAGATLSDAASQAPPIICRQLIEEATGVTTHVFNGGHSGITTLGFMPGRDDFTKVSNAARALTNSNGGLLYFSIMLGTNDSAISGTEGAPVSPETYRDNMRTIIDSLIARFPTCKIVVNYPIWYSPNTYNGARYLEEGLNRLHSYFPIIDELVASNDQVFAGDSGSWDFFAYNKALFTAESGNAGTFFLHPNVNGAKRLAEIWCRSLLQLIEADGITVPNPLAEWKVFQPDNNKKYTLRTARGSYGTADGFLTNTAKTGIGATKGEFAIIAYDDELYLYSIADKKFMHRDPSPYQSDWSNAVLSNTLIEPLRVHYTGISEAYPYYLTSLDYVFNTYSGTQKGVCLNTYVNCDQGNQTAIVEAGDFDPTEALATLEQFFNNQLEVTFRILDTEGRLLDEVTTTGSDGETISQVPDNVPQKAYTLYTVQQPVTLAKGAENVVMVEAVFQLPFTTSPDMNNAHWYNLALREGEDIVTVANDYACNTAVTTDELRTDDYQWAFQGNPYDGIVVYNRSDITKTLGVSDNRAILIDGVYRWQIFEGKKGFLLGVNESQLINEYGGKGGKLGFWHDLEDVGSMFTVDEVGQQTVESLRLSTGAHLKIYKSEEGKANNRAVLITPGGGYAFVAGSYEGADWAPIFQELGYTVAVLTYTTPPTAHDGPLHEGLEALNILRSNPERYHTSTGQVGVMGFSAGGHLASTLATHTTDDQRPAFQVLFYPVITMAASYTHAGSRQNLLGSSPSDDLVNLYSNEKQVTAETPRAYLCWAENDATVPTANSKNYVTALRRAGVDAHTLSLPSGGHGFGFNPSFTYHQRIVEDLTAWLQDIDPVLTAMAAPEAVPAAGEPVYSLGGQLITAVPAATTHLPKGIYVTKGHKLLIP